MAKNAKRLAWNDMSQETVRHREEMIAVQGRRAVGTDRLTDIEGHEVEGRETETGVSVADSEKGRETGLGCGSRAVGAADRETQERAQRPAP